ncbi:MAG: hypothetical protein Kow0013_14950 [Pararhodobacter sp.]
MQLRQPRDVRGFRVLDQIGPDQPRVVHEMRHLVLGGDPCRRLCHGLGVQKVGTHRMQARMPALGVAAGDRDHGIAALQQGIGQIGADPLVAPVMTAVRSLMPRLLR